MSRRIDKIILHCSASSVIGQRIEHIRAWHMKPTSEGGPGWSDVGYHLFLCFDGLIQGGRPLDVPGAHAQGHNAHSIGVCLAGLKPTDFTAKQFDSLKTVLALLKKAYPDAALFGHNELDKNGKVCPVFDILPWKKYWSNL